MGIKLKAFQTSCNDKFVQLIQGFKKIIVPLTAGTAVFFVGAAVTTLAAAPVLSLVGFSSIGPVAGTMAAAIHSSIGSVAAGSSFATAQAIGMGAAVPPIGIVLGGVILSVSMFFAVRIIRKYI